ncbi:ring finger domain containing protein [Nitzschia inconspicua]|uniref:Ring finger domain containing protein n=1 Tax=Nitzschia inconspicua TaxID=303405 RepID=A0A9K3KCB9_9STRA|nr:ring finger domain containing protein [Nitzschia inconspicua]KAG7367815.1 ring finger domain containing protein [Nitzschia inconspicua]
MKQRPRQPRLRETFDNTLDGHNSLVEETSNKEMLKDYFIFGTATKNNDNNNHPNQEYPFVDHQEVDDGTEQNEDTQIIANAIESSLPSTFLHPTFFPSKTNTDLVSQPIITSNDDSNISVSPKMEPVMTLSPSTVKPSSLPTFSPDLQFYHHEKYERYQHRRVIVISTISGLIAVLLSILMCIVLPSVVRWLRLRLQTKQALEKQIGLRFATVDAWLVTKPAQIHDNDCQWVQHFYGGCTIRQSKSSSQGRDNICRSNNDTVSKDQTVRNGDGNSASSGTCTGPYVLTASALWNKLGIPEKGTTTQQRGNNNTARSDQQQRQECPKKENRESEQTMSWSGSDHDDIESGSFCSSEEEEDTVIDEKTSCSICLEKFKIGDKVSWSSNVQCNHTFHHSCVREWLLRNSDCPNCREYVLLVDRPLPDDEPPPPPAAAATTTTNRRKALTPKQISICRMKQAHRTDTSYFCVDCGLVQLHAFDDRFESKIKAMEEQSCNDKAKSKNDDDDDDNDSKSKVWWRRRGQLRHGSGTEHQQQQHQQQQQQQDGAESRDAGTMPESSFRSFTAQHTMDTIGSNSNNSDGTSNGSNECLATNDDHDTGTNE